MDNNIVVFVVVVAVAVEGIEKIVEDEVPVDMVFVEDKEPVDMVFVEDKAFVEQLVEQDSQLKIEDSPED